MLHRYRLFFALLAITFPALAGCASTLKGARMPEGFKVREVARSAAGTPFDASRKGAFASVDDGATVITSPGGTVTRIDGAAAGALCFSPSGDQLAVALNTGKDATLRVYDISGRMISEAGVPGKVTSVAWRSEKELLVGALTVRKFSFGTEMKSWLYRWDGAKAPEATALTDVTLRPQVAKLPEQLLYNQVLIALSPYGDEIAYASLKDPPLFTPYLRVAVRHLETGADTEVAKNALGAGQVLYAPDGESLVLGDSKGTRRVSLPDGKEIRTWPSPGTSPALSPSGAYAYLDGFLYQEDRTVATFPADAKGIFLPDGSGLVLSWQGGLFVVTGTKDPAGPELAGDLERILKLRRLRSQGLITESDYRNGKEKKETP